jgi:hypothetical protein
MHSVDNKLVNQTRDIICFHDILGHIYQSFLSPFKYASVSLFDMVELELSTLIIFCHHNLSRLGLKIN